MEEIYEADWDHTPASIPDFDDICNDQHQSAHDEIDAESWEWVIAARAPLAKGLGVQCCSLRWSMLIEHAPNTLLQMLLLTSHNADLHVACG